MRAKIHNFQHVNAILQNLSHCPILQWTKKWDRLAVTKSDVG